MKCCECEKKGIHECVIKGKKVFLCQEHNEMWEDFKKICAEDFVQKKK